jgi:hypothetical protein
MQRFAPIRLGSRSTSGTTAVFFLHEAVAMQNTDQARVRFAANAAGQFVANLYDAYLIEFSIENVAARTAIFDVGVAVAQDRIRETGRAFVDRRWMEQWFEFYKYTVLDPLRLEGNAALLGGVRTESTKANTSRQRTKIEPFQGLHKYAAAIKISPAKALAILSIIKRFPPKQSTTGRRREFQWLTRVHVAELYISGERSLEWIHDYLQLLEMPRDLGQSGGDAPATARGSRRFGPDTLRLWVQEFINHSMDLIATGVFGLILFTKILTSSAAAIVRNLGKIAQDEVSDAVQQKTNDWPEHMHPSRARGEVLNSARKSGSVVSSAIALLLVIISIIIFDFVQAWLRGDEKTDHVTSAPSQDRRRTDQTEQLSAHEDAKTCLEDVRKARSTPAPKHIEPSHRVSPPELMLTLDYQSRFRANSVTDIDRPVRLTVTNLQDRATKFSARVGLPYFACGKFGPANIGASMYGADTKARELFNVPARGVTDVSMVISLTRAIPQGCKFQADIEITSSGRIVTTASAVFDSVGAEVVGRISQSVASSAQFYNSGSVSATLHPRLADGTLVCPGDNCDIIVAPCSRVEGDWQLPAADGINTLFVTGDGLYPSTSRQLVMRSATQNASPRPSFLFQNARDMPYELTEVTANRLSPVGHVTVDAAPPEDQVSVAVFNSAQHFLTCKIFTFGLKQGRPVVLPFSRSTAGGILQCENDGNGIFALDLGDDRTFAMPWAILRQYFAAPGARFGVLQTLVADEKVPVGKLGRFEWGYWSIVEFCKRGSSWIPCTPAGDYYWNCRMGPPCTYRTMVYDFSMCEEFWP